MTKNETKLTERIAVIETKLVNVCDEVKEVKETNTIEHTEIKKMIKDFIDSADSKYAPAWVGKLVYGIISAIVIGLIVQSLK